MEEAPQPVDPVNLRFLRLLVTVLTGTMIIGVLVIIVLIVIRFSNAVPSLPEKIELPEGVAAVSVTISQRWYAVTTDDDRILIYNRDGGTLRQTVVIE